MMKSRNYSRKEDGTINQSKPLFECGFCGKSYQRESTLLAHMCEKKRRKDQEKERGVQLGFKAYQRFYKLKQNANKTPSYTDFMDSQFYIAFVKFGRHIKMINAKKPDKFIDYVINNGVKLDKWCQDTVYDKYLIEMIKKENPNDTLQRAFEVMIQWGDKHKAPWNHFFKYAAPQLVCHEILRGNISPWVLYNCDTGIECLGNMNEHDVGMVFDYINPDFWTKKFEDYFADVEYMKITLKEAGL